ncbi:MAG: M15 family metallopeptidase [Prochlorothrix sp.]
MVAKPHLDLPIVECGEPLVALPRDHFVYVDPHPYVALGAPYGDKSPFFLRSSVVDRLLAAQTSLQQQHPKLSLQIFDAYRPLTVQQFMVDHTFQGLAQQFAQQYQLDPQNLTPDQVDNLREQVHCFWAEPVTDLQQPPPHSTGAAVDLTLFDLERQQPLDMGSPIDECSPRSYPDHFAPPINRSAGTTPPNPFHQNRLLLRTVLQQVGFQNHPREWWHFSYGDQLWAWLEQQQGNATAVPCYGRP